MDKIKLAILNIEIAVGTSVLWVAWMLILLKRKITKNYSKEH